MTEKELKYHNLYLDLAERISEMSYARRLKVGAIIVKDNNILAYGFNGTPSGMDNDCENHVYTEYLGVDGTMEHYETKPEVIHAEMNCILKAAKNGHSIDKSTLYLTHGCCLLCAKHILQVGIKHVVYRSDYRSTEGVDFLLENGIDVTQLQF